MKKLLIFTIILVNVCTIKSTLIKNLTGHRLYTETGISTTGAKDNYNKVIIEEVEIGDTLDIPSKKWIPVLTKDSLLKMTIYALKERTPFAGEYAFQDINLEDLGNISEIEVKLSKIPSKLDFIKKQAKIK